MKTTNLLDKLINRSDFPKVNSFKNELMKLGVLRILLGVIIFARFLEIAYSIDILNYSPTLLYASYASLTLIIFFIIGFCTPIVTILLFFFVYWCDINFGTSTLGTSILQLTLIPFIIVNSGHYYSIDRLLLKRNIRLTQPINIMFKFLGAGKEKTITRAYFLTFTIYAIISFAALILHLQDEFWMQGLTTKSLLTNSYLCKHYSFIRLLDQNAPFILTVISISGSVFQSIFQFLMIPLVYFTAGRKFVFAYGLIFFLISLFFINLSYLPHVEIILWLMIFLPIQTNKKNLEIFYDDHCNLCKKTMKFFKLINFNDRIRFAPISLNLNKISTYNLSEKEKKQLMAGTYKGDLLIGYNLYLRICKVNPLLYPLIPLFYLGKITTIGPKIYNYIAKRRYQYFGQCEISYEDEISQERLPIQLPKHQFFNKFLFIYYCFLICLFILFKAPYISSVTSNLAVLNRVKSGVLNILIYNGFNVPNVFNETDLSMGNTWMMLYRMENHQQILVPITGEEGERLNYNDCDILNFTNHGSDVLYFGTSVGFRRGSISRDINDIMKKDSLGWRNLSKRIKYDYNSNGFKKNKKYFVRIFRNNQSEVTHDKINPEIWRKRLEFENYYLFNGDSIALLKNKEQLLTAKHFMKSNSTKAGL